MRNLTETDQYKNGDDVATSLDRFFTARGWHIEKTTPHEERTLCLGDRKFSQGNRFHFVEYKSGNQSHYTHNIFLETISVDSPCAPGWVYTCQADVIFYAILLSKKILVFSPKKLRAEIADLKTKFRTAKTGKGQNEYHTHGVLVPLDYAEKNLVENIITLETL
jgi:hypothetical protein